VVSALLRMQLFLIKMCKASFETIPFVGVFSKQIPSSVNITYAQCNEFLYLVTAPRFCACIRVLITSIGVFNTAPIEFAIPPASLLCWYQQKMNQIPRAKKGEKSVQLIADSKRSGWVWLNELLYLIVCAELHRLLKSLSRNSRHQSYYRAYI